MRFFKIVLIIGVACAIVSCVSTKHVVYHIEAEQILDSNGKPQGELSIKNPEDLRSGVIYALPHTVVTVTVPIEKTTQDFGQFWIEYVDEIAEKPIKKYFKNDAGIDRSSKDKAVRKKVQALEFVIRLSLYNAFDKDKAEEARISLEKVSTINDFKEKLIAAGYTRGEAMMLLSQWANLATAAKPVGIDIDKHFSEFKEFLKDNLKPTGIKLTTPAPRRYKIKKPSFETTSEPDPEQVYFIEIKKERLVDRMFTMELTETGVITSGESHAVDKKLETVVQALATGAGIAGKFVLGITPSSDPEFAGTIKKAKIIIDDIYSIRKARRGLLTGKADAWYGGASIEVFDRILRETNKAEATRVSYFHNKDSITWNAKFECRPSNLKGEDLFQFSDKSGVSLDNRNKLIGQPKDSFVFTTADNTALVRLNWSDRGPGDVGIGHSRVLAAINKKNKKLGEPSELGFRYRAPAIVKAMLTLQPINGIDAQNNILGEARLTVAQFGVILALPATTGSSDSKFTTVYYQETGALKKVVIDSKTIDSASMIKTLGDSSEGLIQARKDREINRLQKKKDKLELEKTIRELEAEPEE